MLISVFPYKRIRENQVSVGGQPIRISMPLPWLRPSPKNFHEVAEDSHCINTENKRQAYHLPRQYLKNGENPSRDPDDLTHGHFLA